MEAMSEASDNKPGCVVGAWLRLVLLAPAFGAACGGSGGGGEPVAATSDEVLEKWDMLARDYSCTLGGIDADKLIEKCNGLAVKWFDCIASADGQCICEADDGSLNCEGSWKPN